MDNQNLRRSLVIFTFLICMGSVTHAGEGYRGFNFGESEPEIRAKAEKGACDYALRFLGEHYLFEGYAMFECLPGFEIAGQKRRTLFFFEKKELAPSPLDVGPFVGVLIQFAKFTSTDFSTLAKGLKEKYGKPTAVPTKQLLKELDARQRNFVEIEFQKGKVVLYIVNIRLQQVLMVGYRQKPRKKESLKKGDL